MSGLSVQRKLEISVEEVFLQDRRFAIAFPVKSHDAKDSCISSFHKNEFNKLFA